MAHIERAEFVDPVGQQSGSGRRRPLGEFRWLRRAAEKMGWPCGQPFSRDMRVAVPHRPWSWKVAVRRLVDRPGVDDAGPARGRHKRRRKPRGRRSSAEASGRRSSAEASGRLQAEARSPAPRRCPARPPWRSWHRQRAQSVVRSAMMVFMVKSPIAVSDEISASSVVWRGAISMTRPRETAGRRCEKRTPRTGGGRAVGSGAML